jgi:hypothetical protein
MSTQSTFNDEEVKLDTQDIDNYSPEMETSIWYN